VKLFLWLFKNAFFEVKLAETKQVLSRFQDCNKNTDADSFHAFLFYLDTSSSKVSVVGVCKRYV
jgi:hypothetical protein